MSKTRNSDFAFEIAVWEYEVFSDAVAEAERVKAQREADLRAAFEADRAMWAHDMAHLDALSAEAQRTGDWTLYSDFFKEVFGVRPGH